jgi:HEAT repeat protein
MTTQLSDQVLEVRLVAAGQLGKLGYKTGEPEVLEVFTKNLTGGMDRQGAEQVNSLAAQAIGQIKTPELTKYLPKLMKNESKLVKLAAARAVLLCQRSD